jgi:hypothetical protein
MIRFFRLAFLLGGLGLATSAMATPVISLSAAGELNTSVAGATTVTFDAGNCAGYASCSGDYILTSGNASGLYAAPAGDTTGYVSVPNPSVTSQTATFSLSGTADYFGLFWGSIDSYNSIAFFLNNVLVASFTGTDIVGSSANGNQISYASNRYINFDFGAGLYDTVSLTSHGFAFESDNHAFRKAFSVSEPLTLVIFCLGLGGLVIARRLQRD